MITTAEYLALPPQERWAIIEERVFGRKIAWDMAYGGNVRYITDEGLLCPVTNRDQPNGWWEIVEEMERKEIRPRLWQSLNKATYCAEFWENGTPVRYSFHHPSVALAVQVAALRAVGFIEE